MIYTSDRDEFINVNKIHILDLLTCSVIKYLKAAVC
jgi:hypothetical protein